MSRPFFFIFPASSDHVIERNDCECLRRAVTTGIEVDEVVDIVDKCLNSPIPMRKRGNEVFTDEQLKL